MKEIQRARARPPESAKLGPVQGGWERCYRLALEYLGAKIKAEDESKLIEASNGRGD